MNRACIGDIGLLIARAGFGAYLATHGWGKVQMLLNGEAENFGSHLGMSPALSLSLVAFAEFICALLVIIGLTTRLATIPIIVTMAVAAGVAHRTDPWTMGGAYELFMEGKTQYPASKQPALMYLIAFVALLATGPGRISLDALLWPRMRMHRERRAATE